MSGRKNIASALLLVVSIAAGLRQSAYTLGNTQMSLVIEWILAVVASFGVPIAILMASPYLGMMMNYQDNRQRKWLEEARKTFRTSKYYRAAMQGLAIEPAKMMAPEVHHEPRKVKTTEIIRNYRQALGLDETAPLEGMELARWYYESNHLTPVNGDMATLAGAIRTQLHRERKARMENN